MGLEDQTQQAHYQLNYLPSPEFVIFRNHEVLEPQSLWAVGTSAEAVLFRKCSVAGVESFTPKI